MIKILSSSPDFYFNELNYKTIKDNGYIDIEISNEIYQECLGFGGAITDSVAYNFSLMNEKLKDEFINRVFSKDGLNYSLIRLPIGSCDFSTKTYDYLEDNSFSLSHDEKMFFPILNRIKKIRNFELFASPWSPPSIYKTNRIRQNGGKLKDNCYNDYALYLLTYLLKMKEAGFNIDYMSLQNEPAATQIWDSCIYEPHEEARLLNCLYSLINDNDLNTKIFIWDHNRDIIVNRVKDTITNDNYNKIFGIAYHWYDNDCHSELSKIHNLYKDKYLLFTEGCIELLLLDNTNPSSSIGRFENGLRYAKNYILDSENFSNGFIDWNILLDETGGPNYVGNVCESPIMFDKINNKLLYNPSYYVISHFSKYIEKGDFRVKTSILNDFIIATTYKKIDNTYITVILNQNGKRKITYKNNNDVFSFNIENNSITTVIYKESR